jgi:hypothetical protein
MVIQVKLFNKDLKDLPTTTLDNEHLLSVLSPAHNCAMLEAVQTYR